ncbi:phosphatase PAP2 family protein [Streptomyces griseocarneus]|uniref:phosphatase PAP2 family protein n=1 Tax=Streptomyces griseocarneus TaxID=51201 RepID=UPI00167DE2D2|nr:phosphatase PAP2 family protein [Streptomyces griseocarneus]MBZ6475951.1 phosphatase PAP2 family protein [Streptomyces griseocarneus]
MPSPRAALTAASAAGLAVLTALVVSAGGRPFAVDAAAHAGALAHRPAAAVDAARLLTGTGTGVTVYVLAAAAGWLACHRARVPASRRVPVVLAALALLGLGQTVRIGLRTAVDRSRPPAADWAVHAHQASFPSGHATTSALVAGLLAWALLRALPGARGRVAAACCGLWAAGVAGTRVFLGVHWVSDLVGGWLLATCWLALTLPLLGRVARRAVPAPMAAASRTERSAPGTSAVPRPPRERSPGGRAAVPGRDASPGPGE